MQQRDRSNDLVSASLHLVGVLLAVTVLVVLLVFAAKNGSAWHVVGYSLYGTGLIMLYISSSFYHFVPYTYPKLKSIAQRFDHAMIYVLIAATYTPILFIVLPTGWRWLLFGIVWGLALVGIILKFITISVPKYFASILYVAMGWLIIIALSVLVDSMNIKALVFLVFGGLFYTLGVIFFILEQFLHPRKYFWMHEIFHVCVLGGSALHAIVMFLIL